MSRRLKLVAAVALVAAVLVGAGAWALPEVVRRVAVQKLPELTGRATSIDDVDLNLLTGHFAVKNLRIARRPGHGPEAFIEFERLEGRVALLALLRFEIRIVDLKLTRPAVRIARTEPFGFDFSDLLALFVKPVAEQKPSRWSFTLGRFQMTGGLVVVDDVVPSSPQQWRLEDLDLLASGVTTRLGQPAGTLKLSGRLGDATLGAASDAIQISPLVLGFDVSLSDFDLRRIVPYLPADAPAIPLGGKVGLALHLDRVRTGEALGESSLSGEVRLQALSVGLRNRADPFLKANRLVVAIKRMDFLAREVALTRIELDGLDAKALRNAKGEIDLVAAFTPRAAESQPAAPAERPAATSEPSTSAGAGLPGSSRGPPSKAEAPKVSLEVLAARSGVLTFTDEAVAPSHQWKIEDLTIDGAKLSTGPGDGPGTLSVKGRVGARPGPSSPATFGVDADQVRLTPAAVSASVALADFSLAALEGYWPESLPATAPAGVVGVSLKIALEQGDAGLTRAVASGGASLEGLVVVQRGRSAPFLKIPKLAVTLKQADALSRAIALDAVEITGLDLRAARDAQGRIDLLGLAPASSEAPANAVAPSPLPAGLEPPAASASANPPAATVTLDRLTVRSASVAFTDDGVSPRRRWRMRDLTVDGAQLGTAPQSAPGTLRLRAQLDPPSAGAKPGALDVDARSVQLVPLAASARVRLDNFAVEAVRPYWPESVPAQATEGVLNATTSLTVAQGPGGLTQALASGDVSVENLAVLQRGAAAPFLKVPKLAVGLRQADAVARSVALGTIEVEGADVRAVRDAAGRIDLLGFAPAAEPAVEAVKSVTGLDVASLPPPAPATASPTAWRISLDRFAFSKGSLTFDDRHVAPATALTVTPVALTIEQVAWPLTKPATFRLSLGMPGGGRTTGKGTVVLEPLDMQVSLSTRESPIDPYQPYFPFEALLRGFFSGDSLSEVQRGPKGELILASRGTAWASNIDVRAPGVDDPVVSLAAMAINDIDFSWPNYALVRRVMLTRPRIRVERDAQGAINVRTLFAPRTDGTPEVPSEATPSVPSEATPSVPSEATPNVPSEAPKPVPAEPPPAPPPPPPPRAAEGDGDQGGLLQSMVLDFTEIDIEDGFGRFIDHTTKPPFSEDISRLALTIKDFSNHLDRPERTTLTAQALVGADGALDMRGDLSGIGESLRADLVAELRDFSLPAANPYADSLTSWTVQGGTLQAKIHYHVEGDRITAEHELEFKKLRVAKAADSDEAKRRIGVPLGLAVALLKDTNGDIDFNLPLKGTLGDQSFDWGELMWAGVKQVISKVLLAPFRSIGRLFTGGDSEATGGDPLAIEPVTFAPGSAVIAPSIETQLTRLAELLGRSPSVRLSLASVVTEADAQSLKDREVSARIEALRRRRRLADLASATRAYFKKEAPDAVMPKTVTEQIAFLVSRQPMPEAALADLAQRRIEATRDDLVKARGIAETRVVAPAPPAAPPTPATSGDGRVEFTIVAADE